MKFIPKNSANSTLHTGYKEKYIKETVNTEFLGLQIYNHLNWKNYIEEMIPKCSITSGQWSISVALTHSNQFTMHTFILV